MALDPADRSEVLCDVCRQNATGYDISVQYGILVNYTQPILFLFPRSKRIYLPGGMLDGSVCETCIDRSANGNDRELGAMRTLWAARRAEIIEGVNLEFDYVEQIVCDHMTRKYRAAGEYSGQNSEGDMIFENNGQTTLVKLEIAPEFYDR